MYFLHFDLKSDPDPHFFSAGAGSGSVGNNVGSSSLIYTLRPGINRRTETEREIETTVDRNRDKGRHGDKETWPCSHGRRKREPHKKERKRKKH